MEVTILGQEKLRKLAAQIQAEGDKGLGREMATALRRVAKPVRASVEAEYAAGLPKRGGYENTFSKSIKWKTTLRGQSRSASFRLLLFGEGAHERRDIKALESGKLRHPVYGRHRRIRRGVRRGSRDANPWAVTSVKGGYWKRGTDNAADDAEREMITVLDDFAQRLAK